MAKARSTSRSEESEPIYDGDQIVGWTAPAEGFGRSNPELDYGEGKTYAEESRDSAIMLGSVILAILVTAALSVVIAVLFWVT